MKINAKKSSSWFWVWYRTRDDALKSWVFGSWIIELFKKEADVRRFGNLCTTTMKCFLLFPTLTGLAGFTTKVQKLHTSIRRALHSISCSFSLVISGFNEERTLLSSVVSESINGVSISVRLEAIPALWPSTWLWAVASNFFCNFTIAYIRISEIFYSSSLVSPHTIFAKKFFTVLFLWEKKWEKGTILQPIPISADWMWRLLKKASLHSQHPN